MSDRRSQRTSAFNMFGASSTLIDTIGAKDSDIAVGPIVFDPNFIENDGSSSYLGWTLAGSPINMANNYGSGQNISLYGDINGIVARFMGGLNLTAALTEMWRDDVGNENSFHYNAGGNGHINLAMGQEVKDPVIASIVVGHAAGPNTGVIGIKTTSGLSFSGNFSYTGSPVNDDLVFGRGKNGFSEVRHFGEMDFYNDTVAVFTQADCLDTAKAMNNAFLPDVTGGRSRSSLNRNVRR